MGLLTYTEKNMFAAKSPEKEQKEDPGGENSWDIWRPVLSVVGQKLVPCWCRAVSLSNSY